MHLHKERGIRRLGQTNPRVHPFPIQPVQVSNVSPHPWRTQGSLCPFGQTVQKSVKNQRPDQFHGVNITKGWQQSACQRIFWIVKRQSRYAKNIHLDPTFGKDCQWSTRLWKKREKRSIQVDPPVQEDPWFNFPFRPQWPSILIMPPPLNFSSVPLTPKGKIELEMH
jgi:hypothetical protein